MKIYKNYSLVVLRLPLFHCGISAGFPSPADDHLEDRIDLNHEFIKNKDATFFGRAEGDSMEGAGISNGDLLVIDKSLKPKSGQIAVCFLDGEFTVKRISRINKRLYLIPDNSDYEPIKITSDMNFEIWGVVTHTIHKPK